ncbi:MAG: M48 family metallopeptidase [Oxalicibacterium faecigallinarum]|uniref:M48 family metallopeptidase n=1 Tax=Oxalicibacterium faecigallinarum TaxID=573741 RepID=UPI002807357F|nr:M48 family metallopeptidase [Oxalicibacterium faecigallinarum]MDQ7970756.1 M48 family metallopeptidase [Oxalicibacterium faecigallinarum]
MAIQGIYYDGKTSRAHRVTLSVSDGLATISGEVERHCALDLLRVSERTRHAKRKVTFPDEAVFEVEDADAFENMLNDTGFSDSVIVRAQQSWRGTILALALTAFVLVTGYLYGLPLAASLTAKALPESIEHSIGSGMLDFLDQRILAPSELPAARQDALTARFAAMRSPKEGVPAYTIVYRKSRIGPNAFALPSGQIIMTDELIKLMDNDDQVISVLAHELGHLHERHLMRRLIQSSAVGAIVTLIFGDASAVVANIPTLMLDMHYSREAEREADDYAIAMLKANGIALTQMAHGFEKLKQAIGEDPSGAYLSSHPSTAERIERIQRAQ